MTTDWKQSLRYDTSGLIPAIAQDHLTGEVLMVAWMNAEALERTCMTREAHFFSRSRNKLWHKGETSGNTLRVTELLVDCDGDCLLLRVEPSGPSCHTGAQSCFFRSVALEADASRWGDEQTRPGPFLQRLEHALEQRTTASSKTSYTRSLLEQGPTRIGEKLREEASELADAITRESDERVVSEAADVAYHAMVGLLFRKLSVRRVLGELARRFGLGGLIEKAQRTTPSH